MTSIIDFEAQISPWFPYGIKDRELVNASAQITDMIRKLKKLDDQYREMRRKEVEGQKNVVEWKEKYAESRKEIEHLKGKQAVFSSLSVKISASLIQSVFSIFSCVVLFLKTLCGN